MYLQTLAHKFCFIGLSETWLTESDASLYNIDGYQKVDNCRPDKNGGGVSLLIRNGIMFKERNDLNTIMDHAEIVFVEIDKSVFSTDKNILIGVTYRPPNTGIDLFNETLSVILDKITKEKKICYLIGDYNINILNAETHLPTADFVELMFANHFSPYINMPTRVTETSATLIDNIFSNSISLYTGY